MKDKRIDIISIDATDKKLVTATQAKLNQWATKGELVRMQMHTTATNIVYTIIRKKS